MVIVGYERDSYGNIVTPPNHMYIHEAIVLPGGNVAFGRFWMDADGGEEVSASLPLGRLGGLICLRPQCVHSSCGT